MACLVGEAPLVEPGHLAGVSQGHTGVASIPFEDAVREALCFGWIDSLVKRLDDDRRSAWPSRS
jgi:uncharacterized protein YdeI (YjbR/CyaY-like superfamily)